MKSERKTITENCKRDEFEKKDLLHDFDEAGQGMNVGLRDIIELLPHR